MNGRPWTAADLALLADLFPHLPTAEVARQLGRTVCAVYQTAYRQGLHKTPEYLDSPAACRLPPGAPAWNKGLSYQPGGRSVETRFRPGQKPATWQPIGAERLMDGYRQVKVTDTGYPPGDWMNLHLIVWMEHVRGPLPRNHVIAFRDGDKTNCALENLEVVSRADLMRRNTRHNLPKPLNDLIALRGALNRKINKLKRERDERKHD